MLRASCDSDRGRPSGKKNHYGVAPYLTDRNAGQATPADVRREKLKRGQLSWPSSFDSPQNGVLQNDLRAEASVPIVLVVSVPMMRMIVATRAARAHLSIAPAVALTRFT
jgi:hypothetical protein